MQRWPLQKWGRLTTRQRVTDTDETSFEVRTHSSYPGTVQCPCITTVMHTDGANPSNFESSQNLRVNVVTKILSSVLCDFVVSLDTHTWGLRFVVMLQLHKPGY